LTRSKKLRYQKRC